MGVETSHKRHLIKPNSFS